MVTRPATNSFQFSHVSSAAISSVVTSQYRLTLTAPPDEILGGVENSVWNVQTLKGDWILKVHTSTKSFRRTELETKIYEFLNKEAVRAPIIGMTYTGDPVGFLTIDHHPYPVTLMRRESLRICDVESITTDEFNRIAAAFARMSGALQSFPHRTELFRLSDYAMIRDTFRVLITSGILPSLNASELKAYEKLGREMQSNAKINVPVSQLTHSVLHGDMSLDHARFLQSGDVYIFDFGDHSWGPAAFDIAVFLVSLGMSAASIAKWQELGVRLLRTYAATNGLSRADESAISPCMIQRLQCQIAFLCSAVRQVGEERENKMVRKSYELASILLNGKVNFDIKIPV